MAESVTVQLLGYFRVERQLHGLRSRLTAAERFLERQQRDHTDLARQRDDHDTERRRHQVSSANEEGEMARLDERMNALREQMNAAQTTREYNAFLTELNNFKEQRGEAEQRAIAAMTQVEELDQRIEALEQQIAERAKIVEHAKGDRDTKASEIEERVNELTAECEKLGADLPDHARSMLDERIEMHGEDAMAAVEIIDRRNHEYSCSACMMALPIEAVNALLRGTLTTCPTCSAILYTEDSEGLLPKSSKRKNASASA